MTSAAKQYQELNVRRTRGRRRFPFLGLLVVLAAVIGILYWLGVWPFAASPPSGAPLATDTRKPDPATVPARNPEPEPGRTVPAPAAPAAPVVAVGADEVKRAEDDLATLRKGDADALRRALGKLAIDERFDPAKRAEWLKEAREVTARVVFSASPMAQTMTVTLAHRDTLSEICAKLKKEQKISVTPAFLEMVNDVKATKLRPNKPLKVPTEPLSILIDKSELRLYLLLGGIYLRDYTVGIGREERTPEGTFTIQSKTKDPQWTDPETGKIHRFGDPGHIIGNRWLGFSNDQGKTGFGIHGTIDPSTVGKAASAGCVRMLKADVEELFDLVPMGAEVVVRR